jgi:hypothetical protein
MEQSDAQVSMWNTRNPSLWIDTHLLEMKTEAYYESKDDPVPGQTKDVLSEPKDLDHLQKSLLRVVAT